MEIQVNKVNIFFLILIVVVSISNCTNSSDIKENSAFLYKVDISKIPKDTVLTNNLRLDNGIYYLNQIPFSGYMLEKYTDNSIKSITSFYEGKQHGLTTTYYQDGKIRDKRMYKENLSFGSHIGFWENGKKKFDFVYYNDKREGLQKQWYSSGQPYAFLNFKNDAEFGMQKAWRENGKPYINYEVKDGIRYGLQKAALCYTLKNEALK